MNTRFRRLPPRRFAVAAAAFPAGLLAGLLAMPQAAAQEEDTFSVSGSVELGAEHNSNLSVSELESASGMSDTAAVLDAGVDLSWQAAPRLSVDAGYSYSASRYQELEGFDLDMHLLYADVSHDFDLLTLGGNYYYADANLGGEGFLTLNQYSLYAGKLLRNSWYLRGALNFSDKSFETFEARDADNRGYSLDVFHFFNEGRSSLMLGYAFEDEDTRGAAFVYEADALRLNYSHRFRLAAKDTRLQLGYRWQNRDYINLTPSIGAPRHDRRQVIEGSLEVKVMEKLELIGGWTYGDYQSNLESADFRENRASLSARLSL